MHNHFNSRKSDEHGFRTRDVHVNVSTIEAPTATEPPPKTSPYGQSVMMQAFGWESCTKGNWYKTIMSKIDAMKSVGITHLWLPPPSQSVSAQGYMPGQLYNLNSKYGTKEDLLALNKALIEAGITPVADIVINHRCADEQVDGVWNKYRDDVDHTGKKIDWGKWAITSNDPSFKGTGNPDTGDDYGPAPDLDHANPELRAALADWMGWLQTEIGFSGWRLDFVRGYGARFVDEYISKTVGKDVLNVGEFWVDMKWNGSDLEHNQDEARQKLVNWVNANGKSCCAFDFPTKGILQEAVKKTQYNRLRDGQGKAPGVMGWWSSKSVTFIDNHDTGSSQNHWPFPSSHVGLGYAYILTHPGIPCLFWEHLFDWGSELHKTVAGLVALRKRNGIHSQSKLEILCADADMYVARIDNRITIKMGPRFDMGNHLPNEKEGWKFALSGKDFAIWEKSP